MPVLYVDETGSRKRGEQGDFYVLGSVLTTNLSGLRKAVRSCKAKFYPGAKMELKGKSIKMEARKRLLYDVSQLQDTQVVIHAVYKPKVWRDSFLADQGRFYRNTYTNLLKVALVGHTKSLHIVTDQHFVDEDSYNHFENTLFSVHGRNRILSVNPVDSCLHEEIQAVDVIAATARYHLLGHEKGMPFQLLDGVLVKHSDAIFPRGAKLPNPLWE